MALMLTTLSSSAFAAAPRPVRVMSMNQCTDQLVLMLLPPERIASVTYLAQGGAVNPQALAAARRVGVNHGLAEEILAQKPDLILAGLYTTPVTRRLVRRAHMTMVEVGVANDFADIRAITRQVAAAVGESARGEAVIARMDATLAALKRTEPTQRIKVIGWNGGGQAPGKLSLFNAILTAAGGDNLAAAPGFAQKSFTIEELLALQPQPDLLLYGASADSRPDLQSGAVRHPALQKAFAHRRITYPEAAYQCGAPQAADEAAALRQQMLRAMSQGAAKP